MSICIIYILTNIQMTYTKFRSQRCFETVKLMSDKALANYVIGALKTWKELIDVFATLNYKDYARASELLQYTNTFENVN
jgi:hypothetical protein